MSAIKLKLIRHTTTKGVPYQHLHISLKTEDSIIEPTDLKKLRLPDGINW
ncbi:MAG: hypothetical protein ACM37W_10200 [Actinomycetota bacterium]